MFLHVFYRLWMLLSSPEAKSPHVCFDTCCNPQESRTSHQGTKSPCLIMEELQLSD